MMVIDYENENVGYIVFCLLTLKLLKYSPIRLHCVTVHHPVYAPVTTVYDTHYAQMNDPTKNVFI